MSRSSMSEVRDVDLPVVAALAAIELGRVRRGEETGLKNVENVAKIFCRPSYFLDMEEIFIRSREDAAIEAWGQGNSLQSFEDLSEIVEKAVDAASAERQGHDEQLLVGLKKFCGAVSKYALANRMVHDETPYPEYQR